MYQFRHIRGHIEVFLDGVFQFSADTVSEAIHELDDNAECGVQEGVYE